MDFVPAQNSLTDSGGNKTLKIPMPGNRLRVARHGRLVRSNWTSLLIGRREVTLDDAGVIDTIRIPP
ncbi:hypothetical protein [Spirosoma luteum]|uniref:hypothetical protein n=1 Tax=Spirosoma luteum TaxID=431553 RepID=UPI0003AADA31|nr:hypothetical protein [Spirosoma luteum]